MKRIKTSVSLIRLYTDHGLVFDTVVEGDSFYVTRSLKVMHH